MISERLGESGPIFDQLEQFWLMFCELEFDEESIFPEYTSMDLICSQQVVKVTNQIRFKFKEYLKDHKNSCFSKFNFFD